MTLIVAASTSPSEFALWAIAAIVVNAQNIVGTLGLGPALIYHDLEGRLRDAIDTAFVATLALALSMGLGIAAAASPLSRLFGSGFSSDEVIAVIVTMSAVLAFTTLSNIPQAVLERAFDFRRRAVADVTGSGVYVVSTLVLLAGGLGVWSLIIAKLIQSVVLLVAYWIAAPLRPRIRPRFSRGLFRELFRYGKYLTLAGLINFLVANLDNIALGTVSAPALGGYALAYSITNIVPTFLTQTVGKVSFPIYARLRNSLGSLREEFAATQQTLAIFLLPCTAALMLFAPDALVSVFGSEWKAAGPALVVLALYGLLRALGSAGTILMSARGQVRSMTVAQTLSLVVSVVLLFPLLAHGAVGVAWAFTIGQAASAAFVIWMTRAVWSQRVGELLRWPILATLAGVVGGETVSRLPFAQSAVAGAVTFLALYAGIVLLIDGSARRALGLAWTPRRG